MVKRVHRKKHLFPRFDDFKEAAKLAYDLCVSSLFCGYSDSVFFACLLLLFHEDSF